jgi:hypothetical protein
MDDFEAQVQAISSKLDEIEIELMMNQEATESLEIRLRLLRAELDFKY